jgi:uncharacterized protein (TIGR03382 family)
LRPQCGIGRCRRESYDCDPAHCMPGEPTAERCNYLDDDCNDEVDEGDDLCPVGSACLAGKCVVTEGVAGTAGAGATGTGGATAAGAGGQPSSGGVGGGTAGGAADGATSGAGGVTMPAAGGSASGATGSGATGSAAVGPTSEPATTESGSGCAIGERHSRSGGFIAMLLVLGVAWVRARRRDAVARRRRP